MVNPLVECPDVRPRDEATLKITTERILESRNPERKLDKSVEVQKLQEKLRRLFPLGSQTNFEGDTQGEVDYDQEHTFPRQNTPILMARSLRVNPHFKDSYSNEANDDDVANFSPNQGRKSTRIKAFGRFTGDPKMFMDSLKAFKSEDNFFSESSGETLRFSGNGPKIKGMNPKNGKTVNSNKNPKDPSSNTNYKPPLQLQVRSMSNPAPTKNSKPKFNSQKQQQQFLQNKIFNLHAARKAGNRPNYFAKHKFPKRYFPNGIPNTAKFMARATTRQANIDEVLDLSVKNVENLEVLRNDGHFLDIANS